MKKLMIVLVAGIAALMADAAPPSQKGRPQQQRPQQQRTMTAKRGPSKGPRNVSRGRSHRSHDRHDRHDRLSSHDERLIDAIEEADSLHELRRYLQTAAMSRSAEVRLAMVEALESEDSHGRSASDLAYFIADPDEEVSSAAFSAWSSVLEDVHGGRRARAILETADILRGFSGGLWQTPGAPLPPPAAVPMMQQPVVTQPVVTQPVVTPPVVTQPVVTQPATVPAAY